MFVALLLLLNACRQEASPPRTADGSATTAAPASSAQVEYTATRPTLYMVDALVRSRQISGVDLHLRYVTRSASGLVVHLAFYNNGPENIAFVRGADPRAARLHGTEQEAPVAVDAAWRSGIAPEGTWYVGGATNGTLTFADSSATAFALEFPGFPRVPFRLDTPLRAVPEPLPPPQGVYRFDFELASSRTPSQLVTIAQARVDATMLEVSLSLARQARDDAEPTAPASFQNTVLFDGRWNQYPARDVARSTDDADSAAPVQSGDADESVILRFPRPALGADVLLQLPGFPLLRLPLRAGDEPRLALASDLPPSAEPRPALAVATPQPQDEASTVARAAVTLLKRINQSLAEHDRDRYVDAFEHSLRSAHATLFDRMAQLPLRDVRYTLEDNAGTVIGNQLYRFHGKLSYGVRDVDPSNTFMSNVEIDVRREAERWQITRIAGSLPFWMYGPAEAQRSGQFWVFFRPAMRSDLPAIQGETAAAWQKVSQALPNRAQPVNVVFVCETAEEFSVLTGRDAAGFLGVARAGYVVADDGITIQSSAFYINGSAFHADPRQDRQQTITHELAHLVLAPDTMPFTPLWLAEGVAMTVSDDLPAGMLRLAVERDLIKTFDLAHFSAKRSFVSSSPSSDETALDYAFSAYLVEYLRETYSWERLLAFYDSFADIPFDRVRASLTATDQIEAESTLGNLAAEVTPEQIRASFGVDMPTLNRNFKQWLAARFRE